MVAKLKVHVLNEPFYLDEDDAEEVVTHYTGSRSRAPNMPTCSGRVRARRTSECSPAASTMYPAGPAGYMGVYDTPAGSMDIFGTGRERDRHTIHGLDVGQSVCIRRRDRAEARRNPRWIPDSEATHCMLCRKTEFWRFGTAEMTRHHCRACGWVVCQACSPEDMIRKLDRYVTEDGIQHSSDTGAGPQRVCCNCNEALGACEPADAHTAVEEPASLGLRPPVSSPRHSSLHLPASRGLPLARASLQKLRQLARQSL